MSLADENPTMEETASGSNMIKDIITLDTRRTYRTTAKKVHNLRASKQSTMVKSLDSQSLDMIAPMRCNAHSWGTVEARYSCLLAVQQEQIYSRNPKFDYNADRCIGPENRDTHTTPGAPERKIPYRWDRHVCLQQSETER
ncbi:hypothetical protein BDQ17DRAFT_1410346 [Cyathus striatus]|nr:hypothetical protein BDQ17DRAFT_1410346 [Cyathus striatus]